MSNSKDPVWVDPMPVNVAVASMLVLPSPPDRGSEVAVSCGPDGVVDGVDVVDAGAATRVVVDPVVVDGSDVDVVELGGSLPVVVDAFGWDRSLGEEEHPATTTAMTTLVRSKGRTFCTVRSIHETAPLSRGERP